MNYLAIIPARGGSKSIKNKNLVKINGTPLIKFTLEAALKCKKITEICVSSDDDKILNFSKKFNVTTIKRPKNLSLDNSPTHPVIKHCLKFYKKLKKIPKNVIILQPTSPLRNTQHISQAIKKYEKNKSFQTLVSCIKVPHNYEPNSLMFEKNGCLKFTKKKKIFNRHKKKIFYARNGAAIYIIKYPLINKKIFGPKIIKYEMDEFSSIDIDNYNDLKLCKMIMKNYK